MIAPNAVTMTTSAVQTPKLHIAGPLWGNPPVIVRHLDTPVSSSLKRKCIFILASLKFALSDEMFIKMTFPFPWRRDNVMCNLRHQILLQQGLLDSIPSIRTRWQIAFHIHDDVIKWKHFPRYWPFVRGIHRSPGNSPHKGQWRGALMFSLICAWTYGWVNKCEAGDLRRQWAHYDVTVMVIPDSDPATWYSIPSIRSNHGMMTDCIPHWFRLPAAG